MIELVYNNRHSAKPPHQDTFVNIAVEGGAGSDQFYSKR